MVAVSGTLWSNDVLARYNEVASMRGIRRLLIWSHFGHVLRTREALRKCLDIVEPQLGDEPRGPAGLVHRRAGPVVSDRSKARELETLLRWDWAPRGHVELAAAA